MKSKKIYIKLFIIFFISSGCVQKKEMGIGSFNKLISHRNLGFSYLEEERYSDAAREFTSFIDIAPAEASGYANLGWAYLQSPGKLDSAEIMLQHAMKLSLGNPDIAFLAAKMFALTDRQSKAIEVLQDTRRQSPEHVLTLYQLSKYYSQSSVALDLQEAEELLQEIVEVAPGNVAAQLKLIELLIKNNHAKAALFYMETVRQILPALPADAVPVFNNAIQLLRENDTSQSMVQTLMFHNLVKPTTYYKLGITELRGNAGPISGSPLYRFTNLRPPMMDKQKNLVATVQFVDISDKIGLGGISQASIAVSGDYDSDGDEDLFISQWSDTDQSSKQFMFTNNSGVFQDISVTTGINHEGRDITALTADYDNDGFLDLLILNDQKSRLYKNDGEGKFIDLTSTTGINFKSNNMQAGFFDYDLEGDLDLYVATGSANQLYRNNADGTFTEVSARSGTAGESVSSRDVAFGDFDDDGDVDIFVLNLDGVSRYYDNRRQGYFDDITATVGLDFVGQPNSVVSGDYNNDGYLDLFIADLAGEQHAVFQNRGDGTFIKDKQALSAINGLTGFFAIQADFSDLDNDGYLDLLVAGSPTGTDKYQSGLILLHNDGHGKYTDASSSLPDKLGFIEQVKTADMDNDGDQDIIIINDRGSVRILRNDGGNLNNYLKVSLTGLRTGSSKNNYFGFGSKVEVKSGGLYQMRSVDKPISHFGLGNREHADVVRVLWSNGVPQNHFTPQKNQTIVETQILKGSCPYLYAWNDTEYVFVNDVLWPSALGMPLGIMAGEPLYAFPNSTDEYLSIPGEKISAKDGKYALQFTTELWESPYLDNINLVVLDHPDSVDVYINEAFIPPPYPVFRIYSVSKKYLPLSAVDQLGNDLRNTVLAQDQEYTMHLTPATFQGITELHDLILDFGDLAHTDSIFLFLQGWLFPTDASINVNISQSSITNLIFPKLQVINGDGNWETVIDNLGFPKGKNKTMVFDLTEKFIVADYRIRIRTNMQIYWDHIFIAAEVTNDNLAVINLKPASADLHYRGFSTISRKDFSSPHLPDYYDITTGQKWRDLTGTYTKYGDVLPLLLESDSKYVIMNAGDEISLEFTAALPVLPENWIRDFLFYNDGWLKDGDLNTAHGQTVEPLPFHGMSAYPYGPDDAYPNDPDYIEYMKLYNTRIVTTDSFKNAIRNYSSSN
jgi:tetratricopeptide (TPR) repeat protein